MVAVKRHGCTVLKCTRQDSLVDLFFTRIKTAAHIRRECQFPKDTRVWYLLDSHMVPFMVTPEVHRVGGTIICSPRMANKDAVNAYITKSENKLFVEFIKKSILHYTLSTTDLEQGVAAAVKYLWDVFHSAPKYLLMNSKTLPLVQAHACAHGVVNLVCHPNIPTGEVFFMLGKDQPQVAATGKGLWYNTGIRYTTHSKMAVAGNRGCVPMWVSKVPAVASCLIHSMLKTKAPHGDVINHKPKDVAMAAKKAVAKKVAAKKPAKKVAAKTVKKAK